MRSPESCSATQGHSVRSWSWICKRMNSLNCLLLHTRSLLTKTLLELEFQRKDEERQEGKESKWRFMTQEMARGVSLVEEALFAFEAQDPNTGWHTQAAAAMQNAGQSYHVVYDEEKRATAHTPHRFFQDGRWSWIQQGMRTRAISVSHEWNRTCPPPPIADHTAAPPSPTSSPSRRQWLSVPVPSMPAPIRQLLCYSPVFFKLLCYKIKDLYFRVFVFYVSVLFAWKVLSTYCIIGLYSQSWYVGTKADFV